MKRFTIAFLGSLLAAAVAVAQTTPLPLNPKDARSAAMGGAFTALSSGYQSLYGNPAGFATGRGMLTLANLSPWFFVKPTTANMNALSNLDPSNPTVIMDAVNKLITGNGFGFGMADGIGFTGGGLGLGATVVTEEFAKGETLLGTQLTSASQVNLIAGLAITVGPKDFNLKIGGDLRPFWRIDAKIPATDLIAAFTGTSGTTFDQTLMNQPAMYGVGVAADLGAIFTLGSLSAGLSIRDIAPPFTYNASSFGEVFGSGGTPATTASDGKGQFLPNIAFGLGFAPAFIPGLIDPAIYLEVQDPVAVMNDQGSLWNLVHFGGELKLLSFVYLRAGLNQGWLSAGAGVNLLIFQVDMAAFTEELGRHPGDNPRSGVALNLRLHL